MENYERNHIKYSDLKDLVNQINKKNKNNDILLSKLFDINKDLVTEI